MPLTLSVRLAAKTKKGVGENDCWLFSGYVDPSGYGRIFVDGKAERAHRVAWILANGPIPDGKYVCHRCDVKRCINENHLFLGTHDDNMADAAAKGFTANARKKFCPKGHAYSGDNLYVSPEGFRDCRTCMSERTARYNERNRELLAQKARDRRARRKEQREVALCH